MAGYLFSHVARLCNKQRSRSRLPTSRLSDRPQWANRDLSRFRGCLNPCTADKAHDQLGKAWVECFELKQARLATTAKKPGQKGSNPCQNPCERPQGILLSKSVMRGSSDLLRNGGAPARKLTSSWSFVRPAPAVSACPRFIATAGTPLDRFHNESGAVARVPRAGERMTSHGRTDNAHIGDILSPVLAYGC
jgi:hypothetical protein